MNESIKGEAGRRGRETRGLLGMVVGAGARGGVVVVGVGVGGLLAIKSNRGTEEEKESEWARERKKRINDSHCSFLLLSVLSNANHWANLTGWYTHTHTRTHTMSPPHPPPPPHPMLHSSALCQ